MKIASVSFYLYKPWNIKLLHWDDIWKHLEESIPCDLPVHVLFGKVVTESKAQEEIFVLLIIYCQTFQLYSWYTSMKWWRDIHLICFAIFKSCALINLRIKTIYLEILEDFPFCNQVGWKLYNSVKMCKTCKSLNN